MTTQNWQVGNDPDNIRRILAALSKKSTVRLAKLSGATHFLKSHGLTKNQTPLPFSFPDLNIRNQSLFRTAKFLETLGICKVIFKHGENYIQKCKLETNTFKLWR